MQFTAPAPSKVAYCHCSDCRRWTGAAVAAFACVSGISAKPALGEPLEKVPGVRRWACACCGSPLAARFGYLPDQVYVPLGVIDQAADLRPDMHCHAEAQLPWLAIKDDLPRHAGSARSDLLS